MIREIKVYPAKILTKKTKKVGDFGVETKKLIDDMVETLYASRGVGLAANQIGVGKQIAVIDAGNGIKTLINPRIVKKRGVEIMAEGCLSFPGMEFDIKRPQKITVEYLDKNGKKQKVKAEQLEARAMCHEIDHLQGKTLLDRLGLVTRLKLKRKLRKQARKK